MIWTSVLQRASKHIALAANLNGKPAEADSTSIANSNQALKRLVYKPPGNGYQWWKWPVAEIN